MPMPMHCPPQMRRRQGLRAQHQLHVHGDVWGGLRGSGLPGGVGCPARVERGLSYHVCCVKPCSALPRAAAVNPCLCAKHRDCQGRRWSVKPGLKRRGSKIYPVDAMEPMGWSPWEVGVARVASAVVELLRCCNTIQQVCGGCKVCECRHSECSCPSCQNLEPVLQHPRTLRARCAHQQLQTWPWPHPSPHALAAPITAITPRLGRAHHGNHPVPWPRPSWQSPHALAAPITAITPRLGRAHHGNRPMPWPRPSRKSPHALAVPISTEIAAPITPLLEALAAPITPLLAALAVPITHALAATISVEIAAPITPCLVRAQGQDMPPLPPSCASCCHQ